MPVHGVGSGTRGEGVKQKIRNDIEARLKAQRTETGTELKHEAKFANGGSMLEGCRAQGKEGMIGISGETEETKGRSGNS